MLDSFLAVVAGGVGGNEAQRVVDEHIHEKSSPENFLQMLHTKLCCIDKDLHTIAHHFERLAEKDIDENISLKPDPIRITLTDHGKRYNRIWLSNNTTQVTIQPPGGKPSTFTPPIGWTGLDMPEGTDIWLASGTSADITYRCSNLPLGGNTL